MTATNDIPRIGPATDDGSGLPLVVTYRLDDDERDEWAALCAALDREAVMAEAAAIVRAQRQSAMNLRRDRERLMLRAELYGDEPRWVACPACDGGNPICPACLGRAWVSPLFAATWERQGI